MRSLPALLALSLLSFLPAPASGAPHTTYTFGGNDEARMTEIGAFKIYRKQGTQWIDAGRLGFDGTFRQRTLDLSQSLPANQAVTLKLVHEGGAGAQLDQVLLGGAQARGLSAEERKKLAAFDKDVVVANSKSFVFRFAKTADRTLTVGARIEPTTLTHQPFHFPNPNRLRDIRLGWQYFNYNLGDDTTQLRIDGNLAEARRRKPMFAESRMSMTGHGAGATYGWVSNDGKHLYAAFDFTVDNTVEDDFAPGAGDYAKVYIPYGPGRDDVQEFTVSDLETRWGLTDFTYTDKVPFEHRTFEFKIPLDEIRALQNGAQTQQLAMAFALYGSASEGPYGIRLVPSTPLGKTAAIYNQIGAAITYYNYPTVQFLDPDGSPSGDAISLSGAVGQWSANALADAVWDTVNERFFTIWRDANRSALYGRTVYANGTTGSEVLLTPSTVTDEPRLVAGDPEGSYPFRLFYLANNTLNTVGVTAEGITSGTPAVFSVCGSYAPTGYSASYEPIGKTFLAVWSEGFSAACGARLSAAGDTDSSFTLYDGGSGKPEIAYSSDDLNWLVVWRATPSGGNVMGRFVTAPAGMSSTFTTAVGLADYSYLALAYNAVRNRYNMLYIFGSPSAVLQQDLLSDGSRAGAPVTLSTIGNYHGSLAILANARSGESMVAFNYYSGVCCTYPYIFASTITDTPLAEASVITQTFGSVPIGGTADRTFAVSNTGDTRSQLYIDAVTTSALFSVVLDTCLGNTLAYGESCNVTLRYTAGAAGAVTGYAYISSGDRGSFASPVTLTATGYVVPVPVLSITDVSSPYDDQTFTFGAAVETGSTLVRSVVVGNTGTAALEITSVTDAFPAAFTLTTGQCEGQSIAPSEACSILVTFSPVAAGSYAGGFTLTTNAPGAVTAFVSFSASATAATTTTVVDDDDDVDGPGFSLTAPVLLTPANGAPAVVQPVKIGYEKGLASDGGAVAHLLWICEKADFAGCDGKAKSAPGVRQNQQSPWSFGWVALGVSGLVVFRRRRGIGLALLLVGTSLSCGVEDAKLPKAVELLPVGGDEVKLDLKAGTKYYWKVTATDTHGNETTSEVWSFTTAK